MSNSIAHTPNLMDGARQTSGVTKGGVGEVGDEAAACSEARVEEGRWWWHSGVRGDRRASVWWF
jgi:hypothetical protein